MPKELPINTPAIPDEVYLKVPLTREEVLANPPKWNDYFGSKTFVSSEQQKVIKRFEEERKAKSKGISVPASAERAEQYFQVFFELPEKIHAVEPLRYIILNINLIFESYPELYTPIVVNSIGMKGIDILVKLISAENSDWFVRDESCRFIGTLCGPFPKLLSDDTKHVLASWLTSQLRLNITEKSADVRCAVHCLMKLLFHRLNRAPFCTEESFELIVNIAKNCLTPNKFQFVYEAFYCIWLLTFEDAIQKKPFGDVITIVVQALKLLQREKITRISLAILKNLATRSENKNRMIECQMLKLIPQIQARKTADPEIESDLTFLVDVLTQQANEMSTWEAYRHSVLGGVLDWAPVHKSEAFWRENPFRFEEHKNEVLLGLLNVLTKAKDSLSISVACYDIGEFVLNHPKGKSLVSNLGIKTALMNHMMSTEADVKRNAVLAYQKIVLHGWEVAASL